MILSLAKYYLHLPGKISFTICYYLLPLIAQYEPLTEIEICRFESTIFLRQVNTSRNNCSFIEKLE